MVPLIWLIASSLLSVARGESDSIMEIINTQEVAKLMAERRSNSSIPREPVEHNFLEGDESNEDYPENMIRRNMTAELQDLLSRHGEKLLRSSKNALLVTKKEYLRKDWCKTEPLVQVVREEGCTPVTIVNRFCYGQCNSFYIPKNTRRKGKSVKADHDPSAFRSCAVCKPRLSSWITVTLRCRKKKRASLRRKKILRIKQCKCIAENNV